MAKQLNISLAFTADTNQAQQNILNLQKSLNELSSIKPLQGLTLTKDMQSAVSSAKELQTHLNNAFNSKTGNLDLSKLDASLKSANTSIGELGSNLLKAGLQGEQAFMNVQKAIASASVQINQANGLLASFWTTLKNTARWQLSSSLLHGFMGSLQKAYGYAQDLDESLNNIRIVTGYNTEKMAEFAEQANKAAKALSTTTTEYTDASLIFYQQGLTDEEVLARTEVTIKMANAAGESAQTVSDQLTAVWNNFYDGSKSLEYYADVMTKLGAATASSTDEIAEGLEKFAAVADTVGLSYEYATAALATVTSNTRQSADVVGTAFKTLFARIQDLELGETLDDGTTLGSYSEALAKVGVNILDANGNLIEMDDILDAIAAKWDQLSNAQQVSLAQSVAGVRQYTQLISLMDNWNSGDADSMMANLGYTAEAEGALQEQADIYAESWEAAQDRVTAALESIYNDLIPTDFLINMTDALGDVLTAFDALIDGIGGLPNILLLISTIALNKLGPSLTVGINSGVEKAQQLYGEIKNIYAKVNDSAGIGGKFKTVFTSIFQASGSTTQQVQKLTGSLNESVLSSKDLKSNIAYFNENLSQGASRSLSIAQGMNESASKTKNLSAAFEGYLNDTTKVYNLQGLIEQNKNKLTVAEQQQLSAMQTQTLELAHQKEQEQEKLETLQLQQELRRESVDVSLYDSAGFEQDWATGMSSFNSGIAATEERISSLKSQIIFLVPEAEQFGIKFQDANGYIQATSEQVEGIERAVTEAAVAYDNVLSVNEQIRMVMADQNSDSESKKKRITEIIALAQQEGKITESTADQYKLATKELKEEAATQKEFADSGRVLRAEMLKTQNAVRGIASALGASKPYLDSIEAGAQEIAAQQEKVNQLMQQYNQSLAEASEKFTSFASKGATIGGALTQGFQGLSTIAMGISSVSNAIQTLGDDSASIGSKLTSFAMACTMGFGALKTAISGVSNVWSILQAKSIDAIAIKEAVAVATKLEADAQGNAILKGKEGILITTLATSKDEEKIASELAKIGVTNASAAAQEFLSLAEEKGTAAAIKETVANLGLAASESAVLVPLLAIVAGIAALVAIIYVCVQAYNAAEQAAEQAAAGVEALTTNYEEAQAVASELKETISNWEEAVTSLEELDQKSKEYADTLKEANNQAKQLVETYGLWNDFSYDDNGVIKFDEGVLEELQSQLDQREQNTKISLYSGKIISNNADVDSKVVEAKRTLTDSEQKVTIYNQNGIGVSQRNLTDNEIKSIAGLFGSIKKNNTLISDEELVSQINDLVPGFGLTVNSLEDFRTKLETVSESIYEAEQANEYYAKEILKTNLQQTRGNNISDIADGDAALEEQLLNVYATREAEVLEEQDQALSTVEVSESKYSSNNALENYTGLTIDNDETLAKTYAEYVLGRNDVDELSYKGGWNKGNLQDKEGNMVFEEKMSDDYMRQAIAQKYAENQLIASLTENNEIFDQAAYEESLYKLVDGSKKLNETFDGTNFTTLFLNSLADNGESFDFSALFADLSPEDIAQLSGMSQEDLYSALGLAPEDLANLGINDAQEWYENFTLGLEEYDPAEYWAKINNAAISGEASARSLIESAQSGDVTQENISENEEYTNLLSQLDNVIDEYPELKAAQIELSKTWEVGSQKFIEALEQVQDKLAEIKLQTLADEAADAKAELNEFLGEDWEVVIEADPEGFNEVMDKILDAEYAIDLEIHTQAEQEFESISNAMTAIEEQASKIGEDFIVSASNIRELNNTFPGIIENMEDIGDGSVKLNQQVVQNAIAAAKGEVAADAQSTVERLQHQADLLRSKQTVYQQMADAAAALAQSETEAEMTSDEAQAALSAGLSELEQLNSEAATNVKTENQEITADSSNDNAKVVAENWDSSFSSAAQSSAEFAKTAIANMQLVAQGPNANSAEITNGNFTVNYSGSSGVSAEAAALQETQDLLDEADTVSEEAWAELSAKYQNLADSAGEAANDIEGMIAQVGASTVELNETLTNINNGKGADNKSSSKSKTADKVKKEDIVERYKEINDQLEYAATLYNRASKAADKLYGKSRIEAMQKANDLLAEEIKLTEEKAEWAEKYFDIDQAALVKAASALGITFEFGEEDQNYRILNYTEQMEPLYTRLDTLIDQINADGDMSEEEEKELNALQDLIDALTEAIENYDESRENLITIADDLEDQLTEWQQNNYEMIHLDLEAKLEVNDLALEYIDYYLDKISDDFYAMAEAAQYTADQVKYLTDELGSYQDFYNDITEAYANGEITKEDYLDGMKEAYSGILDQLSALNELDKEMMHYYEDTLDAASEELSYYTDQMEHLTSVLEHYQNLIELVNGEYDYESIGKLLEAQAKTLKNELDVSTQYYQMLLTEKQAIEESLAAATDDAARELFEEELKAITTAVNEAQEDMLSKTEEWAEIQKAIMENAMSEAAAEMEKAFTDGMGFDALSNSLDRLSSYADEYLTKTNQMYETQKLINTAQQAADKSTNEAAKARLKAYQDEIAELQTKNKLSNLELEIAKAKYDIVLAEIALEEAQNAKSTVRLQRDSEGNFGYVYTADQDAISQAEQDLADAQNALYNIGLEGANDYGQKLLELQQQLADDLIALEEARAAGQYATDEEYYAARDQLISEYNDLFIAYSEQYTTALGVDSAIQEEAWINAYDSMINKTQDWQEYVSIYTERCEDSYSAWRETVQDESEIIDDILNDLETEIDDVTTASDDLAKEVKNDVIPAINNELSSVRAVTDAYAAQRTTIRDLITYYEELATSIRKVIELESGYTAGSASSSNYDFSIDYSALMAQAWAEGDMDTYDYAYQGREAKINAGYDDYGVSTDEIDEYLKEQGEGYDVGNEYWINILKKNGMATGGYTGAWGPEGRIAMLHEKELVLNADDTTNFLQAATLLRNVVDMIDLQALQNQITTLPYYTGADLLGKQGELQQNVTIEASFPNVQDRNEIQEAFNNLINKASQYANRK